MIDSLTEKLSINDASLDINNLESLEKKMTLSVKENFMNAFLKANQIFKKTSILAYERKLK